jgi:hypothetical protein
MFKVLMSRTLPAGPATQEAEIILCELPGNECTPYCTWQRNTADGGRYWGHYFKTFLEAAQDFATRGK